MKKLFYILLLLPILATSQIKTITKNLTAEDYTKDLRLRLKDSIPYPNNIPFILLPLEPYVKVKTLIKPYTNYRAFEVDGYWICPIATYINQHRAHYTMFYECYQWAKIYGIENIYVGEISKLRPYEEIK